jgi:pilus assembly protein Flp/PilA
MNMLKKLFKDESGQGMVEYGLIIALVSIAVVVILGTMGDTLQTIFTNTNTKLEENATP